MKDRAGGGRAGGGGEGQERVEECREGKGHFLPIRVVMHV